MGHGGESLLDPPPWRLAYVTKGEKRKSPAIFFLGPLPNLFLSVTNLTLAGIRLMSSTICSL
jgi:hypothetical protein